MNAAVEKFDFETAAKYRDYITAVNSLINREKVVEFTEENKNIALLEYLDEANIKFFLIKGNIILYSEKYNITSSPVESLKATLRDTILHYFENEALVDSIEIGRDVIDEVQIIYSYLKSKQNNCRYIVISEEWIKAKDTLAIDKKLSLLFEK